MKILYTLVSIFFFSLFISSCNLINPSEPVPTYIHVDSFAFTGASRLGTSSHKITVVYAYLNGQSLGAFDLPATFPVIMDQKSKLQLTPGIDYNGLSGVPSLYPFYSSYIDSISPSPGQTLHITPPSKYLDIVERRYLADFESSNPFDSVSSTDVPIVLTGDPSQVFEGMRSGLLFLPADKDVSVNVNTDGFKLPRLTDVFLEINYKSTIPFTVGLYTQYPENTDVSSYLGGFYPRNTWGKVYVDMKNFASSYNNVNKPNDFFLLIRAAKEDEHKGKDGYVLIDNIKIVSF